MVNQAILKQKTIPNQRFFLKFQYQTYFSTFMLISLIYSVQPTFVDELDNMVNGKFIAVGKIPYKDFFSQHTPLAYYISGFGHIIGANSVFLQRIFVYCLFSIAFCYLIKRYRGLFGVAAPFTTGVIYLTSHPSNPDLSYTFLSDQVQAIAYIFILFELFLIHRRRSIQTSSVWIMSLAGFISIGVAFISIYFVTISFVIFFCLFFWIYRVGLNVNPVGTLKKLGFTLSALISPYIFFGLYFLLTGGLLDLYQQSYLVNRNVYSKYIGGFGADPISPLLNAPKTFWFYTVNSWNQIDVLNLLSLRNFENFFFIYLLIVILIFYRFPFFALGFAFLIALSVQRGVSGFHGQPFWALAAAATGLVLFDRVLGVFPTTFNLKKYFSGLVIAIVLAVITFFGYFNLLASPFPPGSIHPFKSTETLYTKIVKTLVPRGGNFGDTSLNIYGYISTDRLPSTGATGIVPWMTDMFENDFSTLKY